MTTDRETFGNGRQYGRELARIKKNHVARYRWVVPQLLVGAKVLDAGCGIGYGSHILSTKAELVLGVDFSPEVIEYATEHWQRNSRTLFEAQELHCVDLPPNERWTDIVAFEVLEHLVCPELFLAKVWERGRVLFGSVPNAEVAAYRLEENPFHIRHYSRASLEKMLNVCGYSLTSIHKQALGNVVNLDAPDPARQWVFTANANRKPADDLVANLNHGILHRFTRELDKRSQLIAKLRSK